MFEIFDDHDPTTTTGAWVYYKPDGSGELIKVRSFKSNENIQKKVGGPDCTISNNKFSKISRSRDHNGGVVISFAEMKK